jgi:hypothetical protein
MKGGQRMLVVKVPDTEYFDESDSRFIEVKGFTMELEHSLASLSKWESIWELPFLTDTPKTAEQTLSYIKCMCLTDAPSAESLNRLSKENVDAINAYVNRKMSATWFSERPQRGRSREVITAELIYFWMASYNIPFECDKWHLNRLFTLIKVASAKTAPEKKQSRRDMAAECRALNQARLKEFGTTG